MWRSLLIALLIQAWALAGVRVTPGQADLCAGSACTFSATLDGADPPGGWQWSLRAGQGAIDPHTGLYRAPDSAGAARVRAELRSNPEVAGEATVLVLPLPAEVAGLVGAALGERPLVSNLPFMDMETGRRPVPPAQMVASAPVWMHAKIKPLLAGIGIPCRIPSSANAADAARITYREGDHWIRRDVDDLDGMEVVLRGRVDTLVLEAVRPSTLSPGKWRSSILRFPVDVRGVLHHCGQEGAEGGHRDGPGGSARFRQPFGLVHLNRKDPSGQARPVLLVTDRASHVLRTVTAEGVADTLCGQPGQAGHRDSPSLLERIALLAGPTLFHSPSHVAVRRVSGAFGAPREEAVVADSGNHVIRAVRPDGKVTTLAGTPGRAGYRDSGFSGLAAFHDPQGLAADAEGRVYVADRGNRVIRVIHPDGAVTTLAGSPGEAGAVDSAEGPARFTDLKGLCLHPRLAALLVLDGHALRLVGLPGGQVSTLLGVVGSAGFQDLEADGPRDRPCLNDPTGIHATQEGLAIADHGNHAVRMASPDGRRLWTVAGDPALGGNRWGLVRDGVAGPLDERFGALEGPWAVTSPEGGAGASLFASTGPCLAEIRHALRGRGRLRVSNLKEVPTATLGQTYTVLLHVIEGCGAIHYQADFLDPGGERCVRTEGHAASPGTTLIHGGFHQAGHGRVILRCVSAEGVAAQVIQEVLISP